MSYCSELTFLCTASTESIVLYSSDTDVANSLLVVLLLKKNMLMFRNDNAVLSLTALHQPSVKHISARTAVSHKLDPETGPNPRANSSVEQRKGPVLRLHYSAPFCH